MGLVTSYRFNLNATTGAVLLTGVSNAQVVRCLFVSSHHQGYFWLDGIQQRVFDALSGWCELKQVDTNTKRNKSPDYACNKNPIHSNQEQKTNAN